MSRHEKLLEKIRNNPKNISFETIDNILTRVGFIKRGTGGSHFIYTHPKLEQPINIPYNKPIKAIYIKRAISAIEELEK